MIWIGSQWMTTSHIFWCLSFHVRFWLNFDFVGNLSKMWHILFCFKITYWRELIRIIRVTKGIIWSEVVITRWIQSVFRGFKVFGVCEPSLNGTLEFHVCGLLALCLLSNWSGILGNETVNFTTIMYKIKGFILECWV